MTTPVILTVVDEKSHVVARTVIDYEKELEIRNKITDLCNKNNWVIKSEVAGSESYFIKQLDWSTNA